MMNDKEITNGKKILGLKESLLFVALVAVICIPLTVFTFAILDVVFHVSASDSIESDVLQEYDVLGYDEQGNAELSKEDYEDYFNKMLSEYSEQSKKK